MRFLEERRDAGDPLIPAGFSIYPLRRRIALLSGHVLFRNAATTERVVAETDPAEIEAVFARDRWDVRTIPGLRCQDTWQAFIVDFSGVPQAFREEVKGYIRMTLTAKDQTAGYALRETRVLQAFLTFLGERHAGIDHLRNLSAADILAWVEKLRCETNRRGSARSLPDIAYHVGASQRFARHLQRIESRDAPTRRLEKIYPPELVPPTRRTEDRNRVKYIPETVLQQIDQHIEAFDEAYLPILVVLRASGWRISDVLALRYDTCLEGEGDRWSLVGDIHKTRVLGHHVPITADVASAIRVQTALVRKAFGEYENPKHYLFPSSNPRCIGLPVRANAVTNAFHRFVTRCRIVGPDGRPFRLRAHAFRHTKAVELINNGMGMSYVQQWLAHLSPEMTLVYTRVSEDTMRKQWEEAMTRGAVHIASAGPQPIDPDELIAGNELELAYIRGNLDATRVETGYCFKPLKMECPFVEIACFTCHNHVTTTDFLPQFQRQERDLIEQIDLGTAAGRPHWVDKNQKKLTAIQSIISALEQQRVHGLPKGQREYGQSERARLDAERAEQVAG
jgi:integrase